MISCMFSVTIFCICFLCTLFSEIFTFLDKGILYTVKPVLRGHPREGQKVAA